MTPFEAKGWKATDKFRVVNAHGCGFNNGDLVFLHRDDNDDFPVMERQHDGMRDVCDMGGLERIEPEWNGEGLPPVGTECEYQDYAGDWQKMLIIARYENSTFVEWRSDKYTGTDIIRGKVSPDRFRPIRTEREKAIDEMMKVVNNGLPSKELVARLYDSGYRKQ